jgi:heme A synthase
MSKNKALKVVNLILFILLVSQATTGLLRVKLSHEVFEWGHERAAFLLLAMAGVHLALNWNWVKVNYFKK